MYHAPSLKEKAVYSGIWAFSLRLANRGLGFLRTIVLARLLLPEDFGLVGIAMVVITALDNFMNIGFRQALIHKKQDVYEYLDTAWTASAIRNIILFSIVFLSSPFIAQFFHSPKLELIIRVISISIILGAFANVGVVFFQKNLEFHKQFIYELSATLADFFVSIILAYIYRDVWALVWGGLASNATRVLLSYVLHSYRPSFKFEFIKFKELIGYGKWLLGYSILLTIITEGDRVFIGKILGLTAVGLYQMAFLFSNLPATEIENVISQVMFPSYSKLQGDMNRMREAYHRVLQLTVLICFPITALIFALASEFTIIFLGDKWSAMVPVLQVLCFLGITRSIGGTFMALFLGTGHPRILTVISLTQMMILILIIYPMTKIWGLQGTAAAMVISHAIAQLVAAKNVLNIIQIKSTLLFKSLMLPAAGSLIATASIYFIKPYLGQHLASFIVLSLTGLIIYLITIYILDYLFNSLTYKKLIIDLIGSVKGHKGGVEEGYFLESERSSLSAE